MRYLKVFLLAAVAVCAFGAANANAALPEFEAEFPTAVTTKSTSPKFEAGGGTLTVSCKKSEGTASITGAKTSTFDELFLECKCAVFGISIGTATGLADTSGSGSILAKGSSTLGYALGTLNVVGALTLSPEVHIECGSELILVKGCLVGKALPLTKGLTGSLTFLKGTGATNELTDYTTDSGTMKECALLSSLNGGVFEASNQVQTAELAFTKAVGIKD